MASVGESGFPHLGVDTDAFGARSRGTRPEGQGTHDNFR